MAKKPKMQEPKLPQSYLDAREALQKCRSIDEVATWVVKAEQIAAYAYQKQDGDLIRLAKEIKLRAQRRFGQLFEKVGAMNPRAMDVATRGEIRKARNSGQTHRSVAKLFKIPESTVYSMWCLTDAQFKLQQDRIANNIQTRDALKAAGISADERRHQLTLAKLPAKKFERLIATGKTATAIRDERAKKLHSGTWNRFSISGSTHSFTLLANKLSDTDPNAMARDLLEDEVERLLKPAKDIQKWMEKFIARLEQRK
jgi:ribosomal protein L12E/L44/L45/RPP1/RPP2